MVCGEITNLNFSLCQPCYNIQLVINKKKYNLPFEYNQNSFVVSKRPMMTQRLNTNPRIAGG